MEPEKPEKVEIQPEQRAPNPATPAKKREAECPIQLNGCWYYMGYPEKAVGDEEREQIARTTADIVQVLRDAPHYTTRGLYR